MHATQARQAANDDFGVLLSASGRSPEIPETADVYGWLVGSWELEVLHYKGLDLSSPKITGKLTLPGSWKAALSRMSGSCHALPTAGAASIAASICTGLPSVSGTRHFRLGASYGSIQSAATRSTKLVGRLAMRSSKSVRVQMASQLAGASRKSPPTHFIGLAKSSNQTAKHGNWKANSGPADTTSLGRPAISR
jgi:hypothetical protein